jgi:hypothetical protein
LEASLDEQYMGAVGYGVNDQQYWTDADWMYDWTQTLMATPDAGLPRVFSISWGWSEADQCQIDQVGPCATNPNNSSGFVLATNAQFAAVTARGVTFAVSSGDSGAHGRTDDGMFFYLRQIKINKKNLFHFLFFSFSCRLCHQTNPS